MIFDVFDVLNSKIFFRTLKSHLELDDNASRIALKPTSINYITYAFLIQQEMSTVHAFQLFTIFQGWRLEGQRLDRLSIPPPNLRLGSPVVRAGVFLSDRRKYKPEVSRDIVLSADEAALWRDITPIKTGPKRIGRPATGTAAAGPADSPNHSRATRHSAVT